MNALLLLISTLCVVAAVRALAEGDVWYGLLGLGIALMCNYAALGDDVKEVQS